MDSDVGVKYKVSHTYLICTQNSLRWAASVREACHAIYIKGFSLLQLRVLQKTRIYSQFGKCQKVCMLGSTFFQNVLIKATKEYVTKHFPCVNTVRYSVTNLSKSRLALQMKCDDCVVLKLAGCAYLVDPNTTSSVLQRFSDGSTSTSVKEVKL